MKRIIASLLLTSICAFSFADNLMVSQDDQITVTGSNITLGSLVKQVEDQTNYLFVYSTDDVNINQSVVVTSGRKTVAQCLVEALSGTNLKYVFENNYIILTTQNPEFLTISGKVIDSQSRRPLASASVYMPNRGLSIVTNGDGYFQLKFSPELIKERVEISYLGYNTVVKTVKELFDSKENTIQLQTVAYNLTASMIRPTDALGIVEQAIAKIPENYHTNPMRMTSYYREMIRKGDTYVTLTEAVLDIRKGSYNNLGSRDMLSIYKGRGSVDWKKIDTIFVKFRGGMQTALEIDAAKNPFFGVDSRMIKNYYTFEKEQMAIIDGRSNYVIAFDQTRPGEDILFRGKLYIDEISLAQSRVDFYMNVENHPDEAVNMFIKRRPAGLKAKIREAHYIVQYKEINGKWVFNYSRTELKFDSKWDKKLFKSTYTIVSEMAITESSDSDFKIPFDKRVRHDDITLDKVSDFKDDNFWEGYNVIEPEYTIEQVLSRITKQLKKKKR